jgi:hydrogenase maturation protease
MVKTHSGKKGTEVNERLLIIGVGTEMYGDDAAGLAVVRSLRSIELPPFVRVVEFTGDGASLINLWTDEDRVIIIDCVSAQTAPGTIMAIDLLHGALPSHWRPSTHSFGLSEAVGLARALSSLPSSLMLYGIQGRSHAHGHGLSPEVRVAVEKVAAMLEIELLEELERS